MKPMTVIQRRDLIRGVLDRWNHQYPASRYSDEDSAGKTRSRLAQLNLDTCSQADVDKAIGVTGWASNDCDVCGQDVPVLMRIGDEPDYEAMWQDVCVGCLKEAHDTLAAIEVSK